MNFQPPGYEPGKLPLLTSCDIKWRRRRDSDSQCHSTHLFSRQADYQLSHFSKDGGDYRFRTYAPLQRGEQFSKLPLSATQPSLHKLAGIDGFEPPHDRVKVCCLTIWLYPYDKPLSQLDNGFSYSDYSR